MRRHFDLPAPSIGGSGTVVAHGHYGRPVIAFPAESGRAWDWEGQGMVGAVHGLLEAGRLKLYCVDSYDAASWSNTSIPVEQRARHLDLGTRHPVVGGGVPVPRHASDVVTGPLRSRSAS